MPPSVLCLEGAFPEIMEALSRPPSLASMSADGPIDAYASASWGRCSGSFIDIGCEAQDRKWHKPRQEQATYRYNAS